MSLLAQTMIAELWNAHDAPIPWSQDSSVEQFLKQK
jgi:hypothetical protein